ncbi:hypothetical protein HQ36_03610 [Porphyromonas gingivicanis]|uniref:Outer membrane lipoprotein carrier protein LolA n=1 Tax=Porphyromonas gingivicanis TaxID=266762 RepID=A0A0A2G6F0_9PORP|nr:outer-membrane lipoprotein carrier protein LolA [Porphyromonas gingivicanis]KGN98022.1 hypothetical protein HQ36_03610 [Porphyromonas gingivicanis]
MKKFFLHSLALIFLFVSFPPIYAQRSLGSQQMLSLKKRLEQGAEITFSSKTYGASGELLSDDRGQLLTHQDKFRLTYSIFTSTYNGNLFSYYNKAEKTFTVMHPTKEDLATLNPLAYLSTSQEMYTVRELPESKKGKVFVFTPKKNSMNIQHIELCFSRKTELPTELMTLFSDGTRVVMYIESLISKKNISSHLFSQKHTDYPGSELVDLR